MTIQRVNIRDAKNQNIWVILKKGGIGLFKGTRKYNP